MTEQEIQSRVQRAQELFHQGFNCSQAVFAACADIYGMDEPMALRLAASFGGGIGRMRQTCGAACGMFILAGLETGCTEGADVKGKEENYRVVQLLAKEFSRRTGSLICAELLGLKEKNYDNPIPEERTEIYYKKRPCVQTVEEAARIWVDYLKGCLSEK